MDITSLITTYGGSGGFVTAISGIFLLDRKYSIDRREELRKDLEREQGDNASLRERVDDLQELADDLRAKYNAEYFKRIELEETLRVHRDGGATP